MGYWYHRLSHEIPFLWRFHAVHQRLYGYFSAGEPIEVVNIRVMASGRLGGMALPAGGGASDASPRPVGHRPVWFDGDGPVETPVYDRAGFSPGMTFVGPAIVEQLDTTTVVFPGDAVTVDPSMNLIIAVNLDADMPS